MPTHSVTNLTFEQWLAEGERRFGPNRSTWKFCCPVCEHVATPDDWRRVGAPEGAIGFACVGRWMDDARDAMRDPTPPGPCNYTGGGLFRLNPMVVTGPDGNSTTFFAFAEAS